MIIISQHPRRCQTLALKLWRPTLKSTASKEDRERSALITLHLLRSKLETTISPLMLMRMLFRGKPLQDEGGNVRMVKANSSDATFPLLISCAQGQGPIVITSNKQSSCARCAIQTPTRPLRIRVHIFNVNVSPPESSRCVLPVRAPGLF
jgi:hypothetical protein